MNHQVGVYDQKPDRLRAVAPTALPFGTLEELLAWNPEKIIIATPPNYHASIVCAVAAAQADILVEKPIAATLTDADRIVATESAQSGRIHVVCNLRFHPAIKYAKAEMTRLGRPLWVRAYFCHRLSQMRPAGLDVFAASAVDGGGVVLDCIHEFDYLQWLFGPIVRIRGRAGQIGDDPISADDVADIQLDFGSGCQGVLHFDFLSRLKQRGLDIVGSQATFIWRSLGRSPEVCEVLCGDNAGFATILRDGNLDDSAAYEEMLHRFLVNGDGLQTVQEARRSLSAALKAVGADWSSP